MHFYYIIWILLPLWYLLLFLWAIIKRTLKIHGDEHPRDHFTQLCVTGIAYVVAVCLDRNELLTGFLEGIFTDQNYASVVHWLLYPGLLLIYVTVMDKYFKNKPVPQKPKLPPRMDYV